MEIRQCWFSDQVHEECDGEMSVFARELLENNGWLAWLVYFHGKLVLGLVIDFCLFGLACRVLYDATKGVKFGGRGDLGIAFPSHLLFSS